MARRAVPIAMAARTTTVARRSSGRSPSAAATMAAMTMTKPTIAPPSPIQRRGGCSVINHHPPAPARASPTTTAISEPRLRTQNVTSTAMSSSPHPIEIQASAR